MIAGGQLWFARCWPWGVTCLVVGAALGCHRAPTLERDGGVRLVYEIDRERMAEIHDDPNWSPTLEDLPKLRAALARRLGMFRGVTIEPIDESSLEIIVPGVAEDQGELLRLLLSRWGNLEFLIVANHEDHSYVIAADFADDAHGNYLRSDGQRVARWVNVAVEEQARDGPPNYHGADARDVLRARRDGDDYEHVEVPDELAQQIARDEVNLAQAISQLGYRDLQLLVALDPPGLNISGEHLQRAEKSHDAYTLDPAVRFTMTDSGAKLMVRLTGNNLPDASRQFYRRLAIIIDDEIVSAPRLMSVIGREGQITGNFTEQEVDTLVYLLRAGRLPVMLKAEPTSEEWIAAP